MTKKGKILFHRLVSFMLAAVMAVTVFAVIPSEEVQAASSLTFRGTGSDTKTIKDGDCYTNKGKLETYWIKYKAGKTGYVTLTFKNASKKAKASYGYVTLYDKSKKKALGEKEAWTNNDSYSANYTRSYGVKKGVTYYFKVQCYYGTKITAKTTAVTKSTANTKAKAKALKKGSTAKGIMIAGDKKEDWYKIDLTAASKVRLTFTGKTNGYKGGIRVTFYDKNGKKWTSDAYSDLTLEYTKKSMDISLKDKAGTKYAIPAGKYWVKVQRKNAKSSGYYTLKWTTYN